MNSFVMFDLKYRIFLCNNDFHFKTKLEKELKLTKENKQQTHLIFKKVNEKSIKKNWWIRNIRFAIWRIFVLHLVFLEIQ